MLTDIKLGSRDSRTAHIIAVMAAMDGKSPTAKHIRTGAYEIPSFNFEHMTSVPLEHYPDLEFVKSIGKEEWEDEPYERSLNCYGVCDSPDDFFVRFGEALESSERQFVVSFTEVRKVDQPAQGGWRWHKWGPYHGSHNPQYEYLHDEDGIDAVWVFHIYEVLPPETPAA